MPDAVWQITGLNRSDQLGLGSPAIDLYFVQTANGDVGEFAVGVVRQGHVIGDRAGIERCEDTKGRRAADDLNFSCVFKREPYFFAVAANCQIWGEWAGLRQTRDDAIGGGIDHVEFGCEVDGTKA